MRIQPNNTIFFLFWGVLVWGVATVVVRFVGQELFRPDVTWLLFGAALPLIVLVTYPVFMLRGVPAHQGPYVALLAALPGMLLDVGSIAFMPSIFPNISESQHLILAAWLMWAYALALVVGLVYKLVCRS